MMNIPTDAQPLSIDHFHRKVQSAFTDQPAVMKLGKQLAISLERTFMDYCSTPIKATIESIKEGMEPTTDELEGSWIRLESAVGPIVLQLLMDRQLTSAFCEVALGGTGTEPPFDLSERPLSRIEHALSGILVNRVAAQFGGTFTDELKTPVWLIDGEPEVEVEMIVEAVIFQFLVSVFGYSGELQLIVRLCELKRQIEASDMQAHKSADHDRLRQDFLHEIGEAECELTVSLQPQTLSVGELNTLAPGKLIVLTVFPTSAVNLSCGGKEQFKGSIVRKEGHLAVKLTEMIA